MNVNQRKSYTLSLLVQRVGLLVWMCSVGCNSFTFHPTPHLQSLPISSPISSSKLYPSTKSSNTFSRTSSSSSSSFSSSSSSSSSTALQALPSILGPIGSLSVLALVILVHEGGHFLAARSFGIAVQEFSVGVGPKLTGFTRGVLVEKEEDTRENDNVITKKDTRISSKLEDEETSSSSSPSSIDFNLRAIPLGGYVQFPENYNTSLTFQSEQEYISVQNDIQTLVDYRLKEEGRTFSLLEKINGAEKVKEEMAREIALELSKTASRNSGNANFITQLFQSTSNKKKKKTKIDDVVVEEEKEDKPTSSELKSSLTKTLSTSSTLNLEKDGTISTPSISYYTNPNLLQNRPWTQRAIVLLGGVVFNWIFAFLLYFGQLTVGTGLNEMIVGEGIVISGEPKVEGAAFGKVSNGDVIVGINGQSITSATNKKLSLVDSQESMTKFISTIRSTEPGESIRLSVLPSSSVKDNAAKNVQPKIVDILPQRMQANDASSPVTIGVVLAPNVVGQKLVKADNIGSAVIQASKQVSTLTIQTASTLFSYISSLVMGKDTSGQSLSGPIGVLKVGSEVVSSNDIGAVIGFAAAISVNLAVVNSLPLPALDGGQLVFVLAEAVSGRKIDQRTEETINAAALFLLLFVSFSTTVGDLTAIVSTR